METHQVGCVEGVVGQCVIGDVRVQLCGGHDLGAPGRVAADVREADERVVLPAGVDFLSPRASFFGFHNSLGSGESAAV